MAGKIELSVLENAGLTKNDAIVYLALLEKGASTAGPIMQKTELQNSALHRSLNSLIQKGLVAFVMVGKNRLYQPEPPRQLIEFLKEKEKDLEEIIPLLEKKLVLEEVTYSTEMFVGKRAMFSAMTGLISDAKKGEEYLSLSMIEPHQDKEVFDFFRKFYWIRHEKGLLVKIMANKRAKPLWDKQYTSEQLRFLHTRYTDFEFPQGVIIFRDTILLTQWGEQPSAVKIKNEKMANNFKKFFYEFYKKEKNAY